MCCCGPASPVVVPLLPRWRSRPGSCTLVRFYIAFFSPNPVGWFPKRCISRLNAAKYISQYRNKEIFSFLVPSARDAFNGDRINAMIVVIFSVSSRCSSWYYVAFSFCLQALVASTNPVLPSLGRSFSTLQVTSGIEHGPSFLPSSSDASNQKLARHP